MALITPPASLPIRRIEWTLRQTYQVNRSGWTGKRQVSTTPGAAMWACSAEFVAIRTQDAAKKWRGFFAALAGVANTFPVVAVEAAQHSGSNPTAASGTAGENTMTLSSAPPLVSGDFMTVPLASGAQQLVQLTGDLIGVTATFMPPLREAADTGATVETVLPFAHVALVEPAHSYSVDVGQSYSFSFTAEEAF